MITNNRDPKVCLITGATSGIGKATALSLASQGYQLLLTARSREKGEALVHSIEQTYPDLKPELFVADLSLQGSVRNHRQVLPRQEADSFFKGFL